MSASMATASCTDDAADECRDDAAALRLKMVAIVTILVAGVTGVTIPLVGRKRRLLRTDGGLFVFSKSFAAGVILATGFVHMLHDAQSSLTDPCLPESPWRRFPFSGFVAMMAALGTLLVDFVGTQFYERKHREEARGVKAATVAAVEAATAAEEDITVISVSPEPEEAADGVKSPMHIVGMHAHAAAHRHSHPYEHGACDGPALRERVPGHAHEDEGVGEVPSHVRHVVVSQVRCTPRSNNRLFHRNFSFSWGVYLTLGCDQILELGIVSHSVIIGLSLGVSRSPCTIRPLIAALSFHQFFEGFALGGCISQVSNSILVALV